MQRPEACGSASILNKRQSIVAVNPGAASQEAAPDRIDDLQRASSRANHISDHGNVVGASEGMEGVRAFLWTNSGDMQALASLPSGSYSEAFGINNLRQVVGQSGSSLGTRAVLWSGGSVVDLNDLVPDLAVGTILTEAFSINDQGQIVAFGVSNPSLNKNRQARMDDHLHSGATHVYLLTPQSTSTAP
jgi:probable HAF family extracellular repeat protein